MKLLRFSGRGFSVISTAQPHSHFPYLPPKAPPHLKPESEQQVTDEVHQSTVPSRHDNSTIRCVINKFDPKLPTAQFSKQLGFPYSPGDFFLPWQGEGVFCSLSKADIRACYLGRPGRGST